MLYIKVNMAAKNCLKTVNVNKVEKVHIYIELLLILTFASDHYIQMTCIM